MPTQAYLRPSQPLTDFHCFRAWFVQMFLTSIPAAPKGLEKYSVKRSQVEIERKGIELDGQTGKHRAAQKGQPIEGRKERTKKIYITVQGHQGIRM